MKWIARLIIPLTLLNLFIFVWSLSNKLVIDHSYGLYIEGSGNGGPGDSPLPTFTPKCVIWSEGYCLNPVEEATGKPTQFTAADAKKVVDGLQALIVSHKCAGEVHAQEPSKSDAQLLSTTR
jgi:hypothetical protein